MTGPKIHVYPMSFVDAPGEVWYGVKVEGKDLNAGWADPDVARANGERYARERGLLPDGEDVGLQAPPTEED